MAAEHTLLVGRRIAEARQAMGLTQAELAAKLPGKSDGTQVSKWERGQHRPSDDTLEHIARILKNGNVAWFLISAADKTETPDLFSDESPTQLDAIEAQLRELNERIGELSKLIDSDAITIAIQRAFEDYATRLGAIVGKHPPGSRRTADRLPAVPEAAA